jgi:hypothetical protein
MTYEVGDFVSADNYWAVVVGKYENSPDFYWVRYLSVEDMNGEKKPELLPSSLISPLPGKYDLEKQYFQGLLGWAKRKHPNLNVKFIQKDPE